MEDLYIILHTENESLIDYLRRYKNNISDKARLDMGSGVILNHIEIKEDRHSLDITAKFILSKDINKNTLDKAIGISKVYIEHFIYLQYGLRNGEPDKNLQRMIRNTINDMECVSENISQGIKEVS